MSQSVLRTLCGASLLILLLTSCALFKPNDDSSDQDTEAVKTTITVYTALDSEDAANYLADFKLAYPEIQVNLVRQPANMLTNQVLAEHNAPRADVIWGMPLTALLFLEWNDRLKPYAPAGLDQIEARFRDTRQPPDWVGNYVVLSVFCVNVQEAQRRGAPPPQSWQDLRDPVYRRLLVMSSPTSLGTGLMNVLGLIELYGEQDGWLYLDDFHKNIAQYTDSNTDPCQLVDKGQYAIGIAQASPGLSHVKFIYPAEGSTWELIASALVRKDPIQPAARTFLDWAISNSAMRLYARRSALTAVKTGLAPSADYPDDPNAQMLDKDVPWAAANRERIITEWLRRYSDKAPAE